MSKLNFNSEKLHTYALIALVGVVILMMVSLGQEETRSKNVDETTAENRDWLKILSDRERVQMIKSCKLEIQIARVEERQKCLHKE